MIKCNRCGNMTPAGSMCQSCGAPLSSKNDAGFSQRTGAQEQSELPAWLESLRVGERPVPSDGAPPKFSTADFIDEGPLPIWMRSERNETPDPSNVPMPEHLSAFPDQAPDRGNFPPSGLAAQSLIDEKSLPSWMKENKQPSVPPTGFSASSLLQQESVPDWMKTLQPPSAVPSSYREQAGQFEQPAKGAEPQSPGTAFGFSARDLIDQQALPSWMKPQGEQNVPAQQAPQTDPTMRSGQAGGMALNQSGLSVSSLLDANSLPQWMREGENDSRSRVEPPQSAWSGQMPPNSSTANTPPAWSMGQSPSQPSMQTNTPYAPEASLSASSFIDANALPEWLRNAADSRSQTGPQVDRSGEPKQGSYSVPPRIDNVRVPSRPRGSDPNSVECSKVAANVFASMLGVASTAPNYPGQQAGQAGAYQQPQQPGPGSSYQQPQQPGPGSSYQQPQQPGQMGQSGPYQQSSLGGGYQQMGQSAIPSSPPPNLGVSGNNASQGMGGASLYGSADVSGSMQNMQGYGNGLSGSNANLAGGPSPVGSSYYTGNVAPLSSPASQSSGAMDDQKNGKKRGLFGAFLDWLSR